MMKKLSLAPLLAAGVLSCAANAQPAIYENGVLTVPQAAVIDSNGDTFYTDIELEASADGSFHVLSANSQNLVSIDSVSANIMESFPVQVSITVTGNKSVPCVSLLDPAISRTGSVFTIVLAETSLGPAETCIAIIDPFESTIALDVAGLSAGTYQVSVNGIQTEFVLTSDNG